MEPSVFQLLCLLIAARPGIVAKDRMIAEVWKRQPAADDRPTKGGSNLANLRRLFPGSSSGSA